MELCEIDKQNANLISKEICIIDFLLNSIVAEKYSHIKFLTSELLSLLSFSSDLVREAFIDSNRVDKLLTALAITQHSYTEKDQSVGEIESTINIFNTVLNVLQNKQSKVIFLNLEGFELLEMIIENRGNCYELGLAIIEQILEDEDSMIYQKFIEKRGLSILFPLLIGSDLFLHEKKQQKSKNKLKERKYQIQKSTLSILCSLFTHLDMESFYYQQIINKFKENPQEILKKFIKFRAKFSNQVKNLDDLNLDNHAHFMAQLEVGLEQIYQIDQCIQHLYHDFILKNHIAYLLKKYHIGY